MARNIAPGLNRKSFSFQNWRDYDAHLFENVTHTARKVIIKAIPTMIIGSDVDGNMIKEAIGNARRAGVDRDIRFERNPMEKTNPSPVTGNSDS